MRHIVLASSSPRRKELLTGLGIRFRVVPSNIDEKFNPRLKPPRQAEELSFQKATAVARKFPDSIIIAADTIVVLGNESLGKPQDVQEAKRMLQKQSAKMQTVVTGYTILDSKTGKYVTKSEQTKIYMRKVTDKEIDAYIKKEHTLDKAGAYAVQGIGSIFVEKIEGDYFNVVGLPLFSLARELKKFGVNVL